MATTTASRKAKGRRLQQLVRDCLRELGKEYNLVDEDIQSTIMGISGVDVLLSPAAKKVFNTYIECKNNEALNVQGVFVKHYKKYKDYGLTLLIHSRNNVEPMITLTLKDFIEIYRIFIRSKQTVPTGAEGNGTSQSNRTKGIQRSP